MLVTLVGVAAALATLLGGLFVLRFNDSRHLIPGFSAGAVLAVALFDLIPEALELASGTYDSRLVISCVGLGFLLYMLLDRILAVHPTEGEHAAARSRRGTLGAGSLSIHSFLDGMAIGLSFQVSEVVGFVVAFAVLVHDFSDGIITVKLVLKNSGTTKGAVRWLAIDALAPLVGVEATLLFTLRGSTLGLVLAHLAGVFLYIGAADLVPESYHSHPTKLTTTMTLLGVAVIYVAVELATRVGAS